MAGEVLLLLLLSAPPPRKLMRSPACKKLPLPTLQRCALPPLRPPPLWQAVMSSNLWADACANSFKKSPTNIGNTSSALASNYVWLRLLDAASPALPPISALLALSCVSAHCIS